MALYTSMIFGIGLGVIVSVINTRLLGPEKYGDFRFIYGVYSFFALIIHFGLFSSVGRLLADRKNDSIRKELIGSSIILTSVIGVVFSLLMFSFAFFQSHLFARDLSAIFFILAPLFFFVPAKISFENVFQGENRIYELAFFRQGPQFFYIIISLILYKLNLFNLVNCLIVQLLTLGSLAFFLSLRLKPEFANIKLHLKEIFTENKSYGFHVYIGSLFGVASTHFGPILLSYFSLDNVDVGYFSLALMSAMPLALIPSIAGTTMFKEFANRNRIPAKVTYVTLSISAGTLVLFFLLIKPAVFLLYTKDFAGVIPLAYIVAFAQIFHGFGDYHNKFLGAHGQGKKMRNGAIAVGVSNLIGFVTLVPFFGALGAAYTKLFSGIIYTSSMVYFYKKYVRSLEHMTIN
ncbi:MAG: oligosaccharide flippase family protein [Candidatus Delongbacteria bacterium]